VITAFAFFVDAHIAAHCHPGSGPTSTVKKRVKSSANQKGTLTRKPKHFAAHLVFSYLFCPGSGTKRAQPGSALALQAACADINIAKD
jgi:hypothetical protein